MSGGWIKWEKDLKDDPRVIRMASRLRNACVTQCDTETVTGLLGEGIFVAMVLGGLSKLWGYADTHVRDDDTIELGIDDINKVVGIHGFAQILPEDWLEVIDLETVKLPGFHVHNGTIAKKKALTQKRVAKHRENVTLAALKSERKSNARVTPDTLPDQDRDKTKTESKSASTEIAPRETESSIHERIMLIKAKWPKGAGHENWITAEKLIRNLVSDGTAWAVIEAGVERYAKHCKATNRMVADPGRWFADVSRPWLSDWTIPPKPGQKAAPNHDAAWAEAKTRAQAIGFREPNAVETPESYMTAIKFAESKPAQVPIAERLGLAGIKRIGSV
jgi:hypothetical protein